MEATTASADTPLVRVWVRELEHPEADDQVVALLAHLRPGTADLAGAIAASAAQRVRHLGAFEQAGRLADLASWRIMSTTRGRVLYVDDLVTDPGCDAWARAVRRSPGSSGRASPRAVRQSSWTRL